LLWEIIAKGLLRNKFSESGEVILFGNESKNAGIAELRRGFLTKLVGKRTSINGVVISQQALSQNPPEGNNNFAQLNQNTYSSSSLMIFFKIKD